MSHMVQNAEKRQSSVSESISAEVCTECQVQVHILPSCFIHHFIHHIQPVLAGFAPGLHNFLVLVNPFSPAGRMFFFFFFWHSI